MIITHPHGLEYTATESDNVVRESVYNYNKIFPGIVFE